MPPITLETGEIAETVTVTGESPLVQTQSGERSYAVTSAQIDTLPFARNNFTSLTAFTPGTTPEHLDFEAKKIADFLLQVKLIDTKPDLGGLFDDQFVKAHDSNR